MNPHAPSRPTHTSQQNRLHALGLLALKEWRALPQLIPDIPPPPEGDDWALTPSLLQEELERLRGERTGGAAVERKDAPDRDGLQWVEATPRQRDTSLRNVRLGFRGADLAVLDMNMPGMSGIELAERLRLSHPGMKLALLTANAQEAVQRRAAALGVHFFRKPIGETVIADILALLE